MPQVWNAPTETDSIDAEPVLEVGNNRLVVVPSPICPETLPPVQNTVPFTRTTQLWLPAARATASVVSMPRGEVCTETVLLLIPSWPPLLLPQHSTLPSNTRAQVLRAAVARATTPVRNVGVAVLNRGVRGATLSFVVRSPSWPNWLSPQHCMLPPLRNTQVCRAPVATATASTSAGTPVGTSRGEVVVPSPTCPLSLRPQHCTVPSAMRAQECPLPTAICVALLTPATATGCPRLTVVPSPS